MRSVSKGLPKQPKVQKHFAAMPWQDVSDFVTNDELYMDLGWRPGNDVFLTCEYEGVSQAVAWTRKYGNGRVFKTSLGHDGLAFRTPEFQHLILNGVDWVTEER